MIENRLIICIASGWDQDPTSKHHVMRHLSQRNDVLWVNYHASRRPQLNVRDASWIASCLKRVAVGPRAISDRMIQMTPLVLPGFTGSVSSRINRRLVTGQIRRTIRRWRPGRRAPVQLWTFAPDADYLAGAFNEECVVYYCVDDFSAFDGYDREATLAAERRLMAKSDVVFATSDELLAHKRVHHGNCHLLRHGVDHGHFAAAVAGDLPVPASIRHIQGPIAGFMGLIHHWVDVELLAGVAQRMPDVAFVLVGECKTNVGPLESLANVHLVGRKPYAELPAYCSAFDVGLIPFMRTPLTESVNPIKLREYLAAGLPVVSTGLPESRRYQPHVRIADDAEAFARACRSAIDDQDVGARTARSLGVADGNWQAVTTRAERIIEQTILNPTGGDTLTGTAAHADDPARLATPISAVN